MKLKCTAGPHYSFHPLVGNLFQEKNGILPNLYSIKLSSSLGILILVSW